MSSTEIDAFTAEDMAWGTQLFKTPCTFERGVQDLSHLPEISYPEVAFAGRSNVGKSSLVNGLTDRTTLARTSNTPGRTQQLNFFKLANALFLVDMPGYGYAKASKHQIAQWTAVMMAYLRGRPTLKRVYVLIDSRQGIKKNDEEMMTIFDKAAVSYQIILTKIDKIKAHDLEKIIEEIRATLATHAAAHPHILATSAEKKIGLDACRAEIARFVPRSCL